MLKKTHLHENYIVQWKVKTNFWIFPIALPHLNVGWYYKMVTNFRGEGGEKVGLAFNLLEVNHKICVYYVD